MANECAACGEARAPAGKVRRSVRLARYESWLGFVAGLGALLAPKCPLCLTAYLSLCGVTLGLGAASAISPLLRPAGVVLATLVLGRTLLRRIFRGHRSGEPRVHTWTQRAQQPIVSSSPGEGAITTAKP